MANPDLEKYIQETKAHGASDEIIKSQLIQAGWAEEDVLETMASQSQGSAMPIPPVPHFGMWVTFQYMLLFIALYVSATALAGIAHYWIEQIFKDALTSNSYSYSYSYFTGFLWNNEYALRANAASLLVAFPIFAVLFLMLKRQALEKPAIKNIKARKMLIYITLVFTFIIMLSRVIRVVYGYLSGGATVQSVGHLVVTLLISGSIFLYFLLEVRIRNKKS